jgi:predicted RNA methylase
MTPPHIAGLMAQLAAPQPDSVILDLACGTGNLLAACAQGQLVGIEQEPALLALCRQRLPETAHLYGGNCFAYAEEVRQHQPTIGLMNPPYSNHAHAQETQAFAFLDYLLTCLQPGGRAIAMVPLACALSDADAKARLMRQHTLHAVMSLPRLLFYPEAVVMTCLMVWEAHRPHVVARPTWLADWKEDGFVISQGTRRESRDQWEERERIWIGMYRTQHTLPGVSLLQGIHAEEEWCFEAHTPTDYQHLTPDLFLTALVNNLAFSTAYDPQACHGGPITNDLSLAPDTWRTFPVVNLFTVTRGNGALRLRDLRQTADTGKVPVISATTQNNGVTLCTARAPQFPAHCLTVANDGNGAGTAFYHQYPFDATGTTTVLCPQFAMTPLVGLFLTTILNQERVKYSHGRKLTLERLQRMTIALPVDSLGQPDWQFMDLYMRRLRVARVN